jgi:hypothetical protein
MAGSDLKVVQIPSVGAQVALWDMSAQDDLMDRSYQEAARFLADRARSDAGDGNDGTDVTTISEMSVEVDLRDATLHETGPAEAGLR